MGTILIFSPGALIAIVPLAFLFVKIAQIFTVAGREMKRLESLAFSPILSHLGESLQVRDACMSTHSYMVHRLDSLLKRDCDCTQNWSQR